MKTLLVLLVLLSSISSHALTKPQLETLLKQKGISLSDLERQGMSVILGEVTGHRQFLPTAKVHTIATEHEAILKHEIESMDFQHQSIRYRGQYLTMDEIKAVILSR
jgi:hypothetical protein